MSPRPPYGLLAVFREPEPLTAAAARLRRLGEGGSVVPAAA